MYISRNAHFGVLLLTLSLSPCPGDFVGVTTCATSCFVSTHVVRVPYSSQELDVAAAAGEDVRDVRDGYDRYVVQVQR